MTALIIGLVLFLGAHSVRIFADDFRSRQIKRMGEGTWKGLYSLVSLGGLALMVWGYGQARMAPVDLWFPPLWTRHLASLLMVVSFVLLVAAYLPGSRIKAVFSHPMVLGAKVWAFAHLLSNGRLSDVLLFGGFLLWAVLAFVSLRQRDRAVGKTYPAGAWSRDAMATAAGLVLWWLFAKYAHGWLMGVAPLG